MFPELFRIGSFKVGSFGLVMVLAFALGFYVARKRASLYNLTPDTITDVLFWSILAGIFGARIAFIAQEWSYYSTRPKELWSIQFDGLTSFGGFIFGALALLIVCKVRKTSAWTAMDGLGVSVLAANAVGRLACFLNGCCFGVATESWIGVRPHGHTHSHLPAQLLELALDAIFALLVVRLSRDKWTWPGYTIGLSFAFLGLGRFIYEFFSAGTRAEVQEGLASSTRIPGTWITEAQVMALVFSIVGLAMVFHAVKKAQKVAQTP